MKKFDEFVRKDSKAKAVKYTGYNQQDIIDFVRAHCNSDFVRMELGKYDAVANVSVNVFKLSIEGTTLHIQPDEYLLAIYNDDADDMDDQYTFQILRSDLFHDIYELYENKQAEAPDFIDYLNDVMNQLNKTENNMEVIKNAF